MRTTVDMSNILFREVKVVAAREGTSLKDFICEAVEEKLRKTLSRPKHRVIFPILKSSEPGTLKLTNEEIADLLA